MRLMRFWATAFLLSLVLRGAGGLAAGDMSTDDVLWLDKPAANLKIVDLVKAKKPKMVVLETVRTKADHQRFFQLAKAVFGGIRSRVFFPRTGYWCRDCEYAPHCRAWKGN